VPKLLSRRLLVTDGDPAIPGRIRHFRDPRSDTAFQILSSTDLKFSATADTRNSAAAKINSVPHPNIHGRIGGYGDIRQSVPMIKRGRARALWTPTATAGPTSKGV
jgi:hypothetical protein